MSGVQPELHYARGAAVSVTTIREQAVQAKSAARRLAGMAQGLRDVASLPDPVGEVVRGSTLANGLELRQVRVPFGVVGMIYEAAQ